MGRALALNCDYADGKSKTFWGLTGKGFICRVP